MFDARGGRPRRAATAFSEFDFARNFLNNRSFTVAARFRSGMAEEGGRFKLLPNQPYKPSSTRSLFDEVIGHFPFASDGHSSNRAVTVRERWTSPNRAVTVGERWPFPNRAVTVRERWPFPNRAVTVRERSFLKADSFL